ncbi:MAG: HEAT repeat domain-containing protein, partial [Planctomycetota bacterium]
AHYRKKAARAGGADAPTLKVRERAGFAAAVLRGEPGAKPRFAKLSAEEQLQVLLAGLTHQDGAIRAGAAEQLATRRDRRVVRALTRASVSDADPEARASALSALRALDYDQTPLYFGSALRAKDEAMRIRAAENLGTFGDNPLAPRVLADTWVEGWGGGPRVNLFVGHSVSYIRDFSVEVAQTAAIADPEVDVIHEGAILDFQSKGIRQLISRDEQAAYHNAMKKLLKRDLGPQPTKWVQYLNRNPASRNDTEGK